MRLEIGGLTHESVAVTAWLEGSGANSAQLGVATSEGLSDVSWGSSVSADEFDLVRMSVAGLSPQTRYYWAVWEDGQAEPNNATHWFRTFATPGTPYSHRVWASSCAGTGSDPSLVEGTVVNDERISNDGSKWGPIADSGADFGIDIGDRGYYNIGGTITPSPDPDVAGYVTQWTDQYQQSNQQDLRIKIPGRYGPDDHDCGKNNCDRTSPGHGAWQEAYRLVVPHGALTDPLGIYQSWIAGRVLYILTDVRSFRDPNTDPQTPNKTLLGVDQKAWIRSVLETAEAQGARFLVWASQEAAWYHPTVAEGSEKDSWANFPDERLEMQQMFTDTGWIDQMLGIGGDHHSLGIDSGANNTFGGFPYVQASPIDSDPADSPNVTFDIGWEGGQRGHYALIDVDDNGERIQLTIRGMRGTTEVMSHVITHETPTEPEPEPEPEPPPEISPLSRARVRGFIEWIACETVTGDKIAYMPGVTGTISRALGAATDSQLTIPAPLWGNLAMGDLLDQAIGPDELPTRMMVCVVNDRPAWAGLVWKVRGGSSATIQLACATPESYLERRFIGDHRFDDVDQSDIIAQLVQAVNVEGIGYEIAATPSGVPRDREYHDDEDATYYQRFVELMDVQDGPEWTVEPDWRTDRQQSVRLIFQIAPRIGSTAAGGPLSTESAAVIDYDVLYDYSEGKGANDVMAYSSGEGEDRPQSIHVRNEAAIASGVPRVEHRWSPSSSIKDVAVLNQHAASGLTRLDGGTVFLEVEARWDIEPARLGVDLMLGDNMDLALTGHMHPSGIIATGRAVGWHFNTSKGTFRPVLRL